MILLFSGFYSYRFTPLLTLHTKEIFPQRIQVAGMSLLHVSINNLGIFLILNFPTGMANMKGIFIF